MTGRRLRAPPFLFLNFRNMGLPVGGDFYKVRAMTKFRIFSSLFLIFASFSGLLAKPDQTTNVIYILADDLGKADLGCYGQKKLKTPNIDRLAEEGMKFSSHYSGNTVCSPSRAVLMTGQHPGHVHCRGNGHEPTLALDPKMVTLPRIFKNCLLYTSDAADE